MLKTLLFCLAFVMPSIAIAQSVEKQMRVFDTVERDGFKELRLYRERSDALEKAYKELGFANFAAHKNNLSTEDVNFLFEVQFTLNFYAKDSTHLASLESTFNELVKRGKIERKHVRKMFEQYVATRRFNDAAKLAKKYPAYDLEALPAVVDANKLGKDARAIWVIHETEKRLTRDPVPTSPDWQLVVISHPLCHFSANALTYIKNDNALAKSLEGHLTLIGPQGGHLKFDVMQKWNTENPTMPIHPVDQQIAFAEFENWSTPTFYFVKAGKVIYEFNGWPKEGNRAQLDEGLSMVSARVVYEAHKK